MKKGEKLLSVNIENGKVTVFNDKGCTVKLSRSERNALTNYKNQSYVDDIEKLFGNSDIFDQNFTITKNGVVKFAYTKK